MVPNDVLLTIVMVCRFGRPQMLKRMSVQYGGIDIKKASKVQGMRLLSYVASFFQL